MNNKIILLISVLIIILVATLLFFSGTNTSQINSDDIFDVDQYIQEQLIDHTFKITNIGVEYDRYLTESDYEKYVADIPLVELTSIKSNKFLFSKTNF